MGIAVQLDTLFIHGSSGGGGSTTNHAALHAIDSGPVATACTRACGSADELGTPFMSTFCDASCSAEWSAVGPRFHGHGCGASNPPHFGSTCRQCFTSQDAALAEEKRLSSPEILVSNPGVHAVMCSTGNPPPASECSDRCKKTADTVSRGLQAISRRYALRSPLMIPPLFVPGGESLRPSRVRDVRDVYMFPLGS